MRSTNSVKGLSFLYSFLFLPYPESFHLIITLFYFLLRERCSMVSINILRKTASFFFFFSSLPYFECFRLERTVTLLAFLVITKLFCWDWMQWVVSKGLRIQVTGPCYVGKVSYTRVLRCFFLICIYTIFFFFLPFPETEVNFSWFVPLLRFLYSTCSWPSSLLT